jgi:hypothetical protein
VDWDLLTEYQEAFSPDIPTAIGTEVSKDGPYDVEIAAFSLTAPWTGVFGTGAGIATMGLAHRIDVVLWSLLQLSGQNLSGYDYGID